MAKIEDNLITYKKSILEGLLSLENRYFFGMFKGATDEEEYYLRDSLLKAIEQLKEEIGENQ